MKLHHTLEIKKKRKQKRRNNRVKLSA